jgi:nickel/cobalt exporter
MWLVCLSVLAASSAAAHPLGNFTINHLTQIRTSATQLRVHYVLDIAEIPSFQIMNAAGAWTPARMRAWANDEGALVTGGLQMSANGIGLTLRLERDSAQTRPGAGGLPTLYWTGDYAVPLPLEAAVSVHDAVYADRRIGWKDIVLPGESDPTNALRSYPSALIGSPRRNDTATFQVTAGRISNARVTGDETAAISANSIVRSSALSDLVARDVQTPVWILLTILAAFGLGALHALEPGHGKALLAFTLVGARATFKQAVILAAALTFAHTIAVILLGLLLSFATGFASESLFTWIAVLSGLAVAFIGARGLRVAVAHSLAHHYGHWHHHDGHRHHAEGHAHSHAIPGSAPLHFRNAVVAAMSGGIAPCPAAIVVLLTALHLHRIGYGLALIVIFSLGLATVLTGLGFAVVHGSAWLASRSGFSRIAGVAPFVTAIVISTLGALMLAQGLIAQGVAIPVPVVAAVVLAGIAIFALFPALLTTRSVHRSIVIKETT